MNRYGFKRLLSLLLACIMMMGCCAFATEEMDAAAQELLHEEEQSLSAAAEESDGAVNQELFTNDDAAGDDAAANEDAEPDDDATASDDIVEYRSGEAYSTCAHAHTDSYQGMRDVVYAPVDDKYHETSGYVVTFVYCTDCWLTLSEDVDDERSSRQEKHNFSDDDGSCYQCGAENTCAHNNTYTGESWQDSVFTPVDAQTHERRGHRVTYTQCEDCDVLLSREVSTELFSEIERHWFEDGSCYYCGAENTCPHSNTYIDEYWQDVEYTPLDDATHERRGHRVTHTRCEDCDTTLSREVSTELFSEIERHRFEDGTCYLCGADNTCAHNNTYTNEFWQDEEYTPVDAQTHEMRGHRVTYTRCEDCDTTLSREVSTELFSEIQRHWFEDGVCQGCGYVNTCPHTNTEEERYPSDDGEYTAIDGRRHEWRGHEVIELRCMDCDETLSRELSQEIVTQVWDHNFADGVCHDCGYVNTCPHNSPYVEINYDSGMATLTPVDDDCHEYSGYPTYYEFCDDCGETLKRWRAEEPVTLLQNHYYEDGYCYECGYSIDCRHKRVESGAYFEGSSFENDGSDRYHIAHGNIYTYKQCIDCNTMLSRTARECTKKESHNYVNGKCENCGYAKPCDHSKTEESRWSRDSEYTNLTATTHTHKAVWVKDTYCAICGEHLGSEATGEVTIETEKHYFDRDAVCICGQRNTCKHNGKINENVYLTGDTVYTPVDGTYHMAAGTQIKEYSCALCGRFMKSEVLGYTKKKEEHRKSAYGNYCWACFADRAPEQPKSVAILEQNQKLILGDTLQLTADVTPAGAATSLSWSSSDKKTATVDANGLVTPIKEGSVTITVRTANGKAGTTKITVVDPYKPTSVTLDQTGTVTLNMGETLTLTASLAPETAQADFSWTSSAAKFATVTDGVVTPVAEGTATITVTATRGSVKKTATVKVKVVDPCKPTAVKLDKTGTVTLNLGETLTLTPSLSPETAQAMYSWKSSATKTATVTDGVVTPVAEGTATITVTATRGSVKKTATVKVKVVDPYKPTAVKLDKTGTVTLNLGETLTLTPSLSPETAQATYSWKTSAAKFATVTDGVVTPVAEGTATITVTATRGSVKKTATVKVKVVDPLKPKAVKLDKTGTVWLDLDSTMQLWPHLEPMDLDPEKGEVTYSWKSSSPKIATVDSNGEVTPVSTGTATITVTATRGSTKLTARVKVRVCKPGEPDALFLRCEFTDASGVLRLQKNQMCFIGTEVQPSSARRNVYLEYSSSNEQVVTVTKGNGDTHVFAAGVGTATITVRDTHSGKKATMKVVVKK